MGGKGRSLILRLNGIEKKRGGFPSLSLHRTGVRDFFFCQKGKGQCLEKREARRFFVQRKGAWKNRGEKERARGGGRDRSISLLRGGGREVRNSCVQEKNNR